MPPYETVQATDLLFMWAIGLVLAIAVVLARGSRVFTFSFSKPAEDADEPHTFPGGVSETNRPVPIFIWLVFIGYFVWATAYVVFCGSSGVG
jgi:hypothetical protein